jgi:hypothetical protein
MELDQQKTQVKVTPDMWSQLMSLQRKWKAVDPRTGRLDMTLNRSHKRQRHQSNLQ